MSLHYGHVHELLEIPHDPRYYAYCQCGWCGPLRIAKTTADNDAIRHELHARGPGPYA